MDALTTNQKLLKQRANITQEIIDTEASYVADLRVLISTYRDPLLSSKLIPKEEVVKIFLNVDALLALHQGVERQLTSGQNFWTIVGREAANFKIYAIYCDGSEKALDIWKSHLKSAGKKLQTWHQNISDTEGPTKGLYIKDFLIKPIQRICKYPLLLRSLSECSFGVEKQQIEQALNQINSILEELNAIKDQNINIQNMQKYQWRITLFPGRFMTPTRKFIREASVKYCKGQLTDQMSWSPSNATPVVMLLFSDMFMLCSKKSTKSQKLTPIRIQPIFETTLTEASSQHPHCGVAFHIEFAADYYYKLNHMIFCEKPVEKLNLFKIIQETIQIGNEKQRKKLAKEEEQQQEALVALSDSLSQAITDNKSKEIAQLFKHPQFLRFVNKPNSKGHSPLHVAAKIGNQDAMLDLLNLNSIIVDGADHDGSTPLHSAAESGFVVGAALLLACDADLDIKNNNNKTPKDVARAEIGDLIAIFLSGGKPILAKQYPIISKLSSLKNMKKQSGWSKLGRPKTGSRSDGSNHNLRGSAGPVSPKQPRSVLEDLSGSDLSEASHQDDTTTSLDQEPENPIHNSPPECNNGQTSPLSRSGGSQFSRTVMLEPVQPGPELPVVPDKFATQAWPAGHTPQAAQQPAFPQPVQPGQVRAPHLLRATTGPSGGAPTRQQHAGSSPVIVIKKGGPPSPTPTEDPQRKRCVSAGQNGRAQGGDQAMNPPGQYNQAPPVYNQQHHQLQHAPSQGQQFHQQQHQQHQPPVNSQLPSQFQSSPGVLQPTRGGLQPGHVVRGGGGTPRPQQQHNRGGTAPYQHQHQAMADHMSPSFQPQYAAGGTPPQPSLSTDPYPHYNHNGAPVPVRTSSIQQDPAFMERFMALERELERLRPFEQQTIQLQTQLKQTEAKLSHVTQELIQLKHENAMLKLNPN